MLAACSYTTSWDQRDPHVDGVVAYVPSYVVWGAVGTDDPKGPSGWSWHGRPLHFVPITDSVPKGQNAFTVALRNKVATAAARIPVERIHGPVLLVGSDADAIWPSGMMARTIAKELKESHFGFPVTLLVFNDASHRLFGQGPSPISQTYTYPGGSSIFQFGGTAEGTHAGRDRAWAALGNYLKSLNSQRKTSENTNS